MAPKRPIAVIWTDESSKAKGQNGLILDEKWAKSATEQSQAEPDESGYLGHVITWHDVKVGDQGNFRVFVHSLSRSSKRRDFFSFEVQRHGRIHQPVEQEEADARLYLATVATNWAGEGQIKSSLFRELPSGQVLEEHTRQIDAFIKGVLSLPSNVALLSDQRDRPKGVRRETISFSSSQKDAIVLAKLYAIRSETGTTRVAKRICEELNIESSILYTAVRIARSKGWLTEGTKGVAGARMTEEGEAFFVKHDGPTRLEKILGRKLGK